MSLKGLLSVALVQLFVAETAALSLEGNRLQPALQELHWSSRRSTASSRTSLVEDAGARDVAADGRGHFSGDSPGAAPSSEDGGERPHAGDLIASMHNYHFHHTKELDPMGVAKPDPLALFFSLLGGACMGAYPVPIKAPSVLAANVHPVIFQTYKSFWVFVTGLIFLLVRVVRGKEQIFEFSWLGVLSAAFWIPAGLCCITAVPRLGMGLTMTLLAGTAATLSFLLFWLVLGERMKVHYAHGSPFYLAPLYLFCVVSLMAALVSVPNLGKRGAEPAAPSKKEELEPAPTAAAAPDGKYKLASQGPYHLSIGFVAALLAGVCCTVQYGVVNVAKRYVLGPCAETPHTCPSYLVERFDVFGSWMASFGSGALGISTLSVLALWLSEKARGKPLSSFQWDAMMIPGNISGILWAAGNVFQLAALTRGGSAIMMPFNQACSLLLTGLWGLVYYREVEGLARSSLWFAIAGCLVAMIVLLSHEKEK